jgi:hypothetical protein
MLGMDDLINRCPKLTAPSRVIARHEAKGGERGEVEREAIKKPCSRRANKFNLD